MKSLLTNKYFLVLIAIALGILSGYLFWDDNIVEELSEKFIEAQIGVDIDLTPNSPEH